MSIAHRKGQKISHGRAYRDRMFARRYVANKGNGTKTGLELFNTTDRHTASQLASVALKKVEIRELIESYAEGAIRRINDLSIDAQSEKVRLEANRDIADRAGYKAIERTESTQIIVNLAGTLAGKRSVEPSNTPALAADPSVPGIEPPEQNAV